MNVTTTEPLVRRSANFKPSLWSFDYIQSLSSIYDGEDYVARADNLKNTVKVMIRGAENPLNMLELLDDLQRLGISYHFEDEIRDALEMLYQNYYKTPDKWDGIDLNLKALGFRLLRQHGYQISQEIFHNFKDKIQNLKPHLLKDMVGMLNLYEASYHSFKDEKILDDARDFTTKYLKDNLEKIEPRMLSIVSHALELPLHWRVPRVEARWFINVYEKRSSMDPILTELAKLDFNMIQAIHLEDLKHASRWWKNTSWDKKLSFARDRLVENFIWTIGYGYQPQYSLGRRNLVKVNSLITVIDDVYDVYGTLDELEKFTDVVERWDINALDELPDYMKICFLGFYNTIHEMAYNTLTNTGFNNLPYVTKAWADLCKAWLVEARWYHSGYTPTLDEYLNNAYVSISAPVILMHCNFSTSISSSAEILQGIERSKNMVYCSSMILRLADDLGGATCPPEMTREDNPKAIQCYMHDTGATEEEAKTYIEKLIMDTWKTLNREQEGATSGFLREFIDYAKNVARTAQFMYAKGEGHSFPEITKSHVLSLLVNPFEG
nr:R-linalool synthase QH1, chloroplastic-like [Tanacetum cinerariifolium]